MRGFPEFIKSIPRFLKYSKMLLYKLPEMIQKIMEASILVVTIVGKIGQ